MASLVYTKWFGDGHGTKEDRRRGSGEQAHGQDHAIHLAGSVFFLLK